MRILVAPPDELLLELLAEELLLEEELLEEDELDEELEDEELETTPPTQVRLSAVTR